MLDMATVRGFDWDDANSEYDLIWDSSRDDFFTLGSNVWDIEYVGSNTNFPIYIKGGIDYGANPANGVYSHWSVIDMEIWEVSGSTYPHEVVVVDDAHGIRV